jgi:hypothetical protein
MRHQVLAALMLAGLVAVAASPARASAGHLHYFLTCPSTGWAAVFQTFGLSAVDSASAADVLVVCPGIQAPATPDGWLRDGRLLVLEGDASAGASFGFNPSDGDPVDVRNVQDQHQPDLLIVWKDALRLRPTRLPEGARVLARDRWSGLPLMATFRPPQGGGLWVAAPPGDSAYQRFPFLASALLDAGFRPPLRTQALWAFFDSAYRQRADLRFLAKRWREYGIGALHVSAWQHWERDEARDAWLRALIEACHQQGILVYAWFEFPHVSERFWEQHPECREQTALGQDAHLDWRKLINLSDPTCAGRVKQQAADLLAGFAWDGANLAELYYESLHGPANPARLTPMSATIRGRFQKAHGFDPAELFREGSAQHQSRNAEGLARFLDFRRREVAALHVEWLQFLAQASAKAPQPLHLVVTQIDDRFDNAVRDHLAADSNAVLQLMHQHPFTLLVEDPATIWHLGPSRYPNIAQAYAPVTPYPGRIAIDINIFPRYQEVYPTKQQTGMELYRLVHAAAHAFPRVALYFEHTLSAQDLPLLAAAAVAPARLSRDGATVLVESAQPVGLRWEGPALVNGRAWAARDAHTLWLPAGRHRVQPATDDPGLVLQRLSATLKQIRGNGHKVELHYEAESRAIAHLNRQPTRVWVDGEPVALSVWKATEGYYLMLPAGEHLVRMETTNPAPELATQ